MDKKVSRQMPKFRKRSRIQVGMIVSLVTVAPLLVTGDWGYYPIQ